MMLMCRQHQQPCCPLPTPIRLCQPNAEERRPPAFLPEHLAARAVAWRRPCEFLDVLQAGPCADAGHTGAAAVASDGGEPISPSVEQSQPQPQPQAPATEPQAAAAVDDGLGFRYVGS